MCSNLQIVERSKSGQVFDFAARSRAVQGRTVHAPSVDKGEGCSYRLPHRNKNAYCAVFTRIDD